jgi:hypothetical protein
MSFEVGDWVTVFPKNWKQIYPEEYQIISTNSNCYGLNAHNPPRGSGVTLDSNGYPLFHEQFLTLSKRANKKELL